MSSIQQTIRKSNALIEASYRLSIFEQRIILMCLSQIGKDEKVTDQVMYHVSAKDIAESAGIAPQAAYMRLKEAAERLFDRQVTLYQEPNGGGPRKPLQTRWIQSRAEYANAGVEIRFSNDILPYLSEIHEQFTWFKYAHVARMNSAYAVRLFELLMQWQESTQKREVEVAWLRGILQVEDKYPAMKDFKKGVIDPAVKQINEFSPINVKWEQRKTGRNVTHFIFSYVFKEPRRALKKITPPGGNTEANGEGREQRLFGYRVSVLTAHAKEGEHYIDIARRLKEEGVDPS